MSTLAMPVRWRHDRVFYALMAVAIAAVVFAGFARTFYLTGRFHGPPLDRLRIVHGGLFTSWIALFFVQTLLVAARRTDLHRRVGVAGAVLAATMVGVGTFLAISAARAGRAPGGVDPRSFLLIPLADMAVFAALVAAGILLRRRPEAHKRLMLLATASILAAAAARLPIALASAGPLFYFGVVDLFVLAGPVYDAVTRRKVHPAYVWGGLLIVLSQPARLMLSGSAVWLAIADRLTGK